MHATTVAIDLAKDVFELACADADHRIVGRKRLSRRAFAHALDKRDTARRRVRAQHQQSLNRLQAWALTLQQRVGHNKAAVALANKLARRLWAMEHHHAAFDADHISVRAA